MHVSATHLKNKLGQCLEASVKEPVIVEKGGRPASVVISYEAFRRFLTLEDRIWALQAFEAEQKGYLGVEKSAEFIEELKKRSDDNSED